MATETDSDAVRSPPGAPCVFNPSRLSHLYLIVRPNFTGIPPPPLNPVSTSTAPSTQRSVSTVSTASTISNDFAADFEESEATLQGSAPPVQGFPETPAPPTREATLRALPSLAPCRRPPSSTGSDDDARVLNCGGAEDAALKGRCRAAFGDALFERVHDYLRQVRRDGCSEKQVANELVSMVGETRYKDCFLVDQLVFVEQQRHYRA